MIRIIVADAPLAEQRRVFEIKASEALTVAEIVARALPRVPENETPRIRVTLGGERDAAVVPHGLWRAVRPKSGAVVSLRYVPGDPLNIAIQTVLFFEGIGLPAVGSFLVGGGLTTSLVTSAVVGALTASLIPVPPKQRQLPDPEELYQLDGWQNQANPNEAIPFPVGRIRMAPLFAARPYTEVIDGQQYLFGLFVWGHGRLEISDLRVKDTALAALGDVVVNTREGTGSDAPLALIREQVIEDRLAITLAAPAPDPKPTTWTSPRQSDRIRIIAQMPGGMFNVKNTGEMRGAKVELSIRQRLAGTSEWSDVYPEAALISASSNSGFFRQFEWRVPSRGQWEVEVYRVTKPGGIATTDTVVLAAIAGIRERAPLAYDGPLALTEVRIRASSLANGTLDSFNGVVQRYAPVWTGSVWTDALTRNPASAALALARSPAGAWPVSDDAIHWDEFAALYEHCEAKGLKFDRVLSGDLTFGEALHSALAAGRATWRRDGTGWGLIIDRPQPDVVDRISPINASAIRLSRSYLRRPDAFRVSFRDETNGWEQTERIVPWPGFEGVPSVLEELQLDGKTDPDEIWIEARRRQHELDLRADTITCIQSGLVRHATRGDAVAVSCDILDRVQVAARVRSVSGASVILDAPVIMEEGLQYAVKWQSYDAEDTVGGVVQSAVLTVPGETRMLVLTQEAERPEPGAVVHFGVAARVDLPMRISGIEAADDQSMRLILTNDAPEIDTLTDAEVPPAWTPIAGEEVLTAGTPDTPLVSTISVAAAEYDYSGVAATAVSVPVSLPASNRVSIARIEVSHRETGTASWEVTDLSGNSGIVVLAYPLGTEIEIFATAVSVFGDASAPSSTETVEVTGSITLPEQLDAESMSIEAGLGHAGITLATASDTAEVQLFRVPAGVELDPGIHTVGGPRAVSTSSSVVLIDGDSTRGDMILAGDMSDAGAWTVTDATIAGGAASNAIGTVGQIAQDLTLAEGGTYRGQIVVAGLTAGTVTVRLGGGTSVSAIPIEAEGSHVFSLTAALGNDRLEIEWSADCDGAVVSIVLFRASATTAPQGAHDYYVAPVNSNQVATTPTGPITVTII